MHSLDEQSGKLVEHYEQIVFDALPLYCTFCKHQGHEDADWQLMIQKKGERVIMMRPGSKGDKTNNVEQL